VQLGRHEKPVIVANIDNFWTPFLNLLTHMKADTFIRAGLDVRFTVVDDATKIVPAVVGHWSSRAAAEDAAVLAKF
jgi:predicted Rossmann-fold nucleotide-binding protein